MGMGERSGSARWRLPLAGAVLAVGLVAGCGGESAEVPQDAPVDDTISDGGSQ